MPKYKATAYIRLSYTDDHSSESDSVSNQRKLIENFVERNPDIEVVSEKIDDGYSGIIFDRPAFKEMMQDVTDGNINCVIVKDLSRLGREYIETGRYLRRVFPAYGVRFIAITDSIDTAHDSGDDLTVSVKNIMNEAYCRDISIKTRTSLDVKRRNGDFVGAFPVYGYMKAEDNKNLLVPDPYAARVVCDIFRMRLEGASASKIASELNRLGILSPLAYKKNNGLPYAKKGYADKADCKWSATTIIRILQDETYTGTLVQGKQGTPHYKIKQMEQRPASEWVRVPDAHEALIARQDFDLVQRIKGLDIIDRQTWEKVQALQKGTRRKKPTVTQEPSVFSGLLKCPECGGNLNFHFNQNNHDIKFFSCQNHNSGYRKCSKTHYIRLDFLEQVVLYEVKRLACFASEYENDFIKAMIGRSAKVAENTALRKQRELDALTARDRELDMLFERLYEDNVAGKIDDARFAKMSKRYEQEQGENAKKIKALRLELKKDESKRMDIDDFLETVRRYTDVATITKRMVAELIDHIEVYHAEKQDGITNQRVVIHYNCIGAFDVPDRRKIPEADIIMETRKGVALSYAPEQVAV